MKVIFTSQNADYDETTKTYTFELNPAISNFRTLKLQDIVFVLENYTTAPNEVFLRSELLRDGFEHGIIRQIKKDKSDGLQHGSNILAMLTENTDKFRYHLKNPTEFKFRNNIFLPKIDFYFTDSEHNVLDMRASASVAVSASDEELESLTDLVFWTDFSYPNAMTDVNNAVIPAEANQNCNHIQDRKLPTLKFSLSYGTHLATCLVGQTIGVTRAGSWQSKADSSAWPVGTGVLQDEFHFHMLVNFPDITAFCFLFLSEFISLAFYQGSLVSVVANQYTNTISAQILQDVPYIISLQRVLHQNTWDFDVTVQPANDLNNQGTMTDTVLATSQQILDTSAWDNVRIGAANTHFAQQQSHLLLCNGSNVADFNLIIAWLKAKSNGTETANEPVSATESHFSIFAELSDKY